MTTKLTPTPPPNTTTNRKPKLLFTLNTPYPAIQWPGIAPTAQTTILEHLCNILSPVGARKRLLPPPPSTARRNRKRKRASSAPSTTTAVATPPPPVPEISKYLTIGLNSTTAHLEGLAGDRRPVAFAPPATQGGRENGKPAMRAVFVTRADSQPSLLHSHIPLLCALASGAGEGEGVVRLVQLPRGSEVRLADALGIARAGFVGLLEGAPEEVVARLMEVVERLMLHCMEKGRGKGRVLRRLELCMDGWMDGRVYVNLYMWSFITFDPLHGTNHSDTTCTITTISLHVHEKTLSTLYDNWVAISFIGAAAPL